ncbi:hypothetical protein DSECCO2_510510 [anaerobic digester metagenome]
MSHRSEIHDFLRRGRGEEREARIAHAHSVAVVAKDGERVSGERARGNVQHARQHLTCDLIHIWDHQQQALRGGVGGGQSARLERAVHSTGGAALGLHLNDLHRLTEQILLAVGRPSVHMFRHGRGRGDGKDAGNFGKRVGNIRRRFVAIHDCDIFCHIGALLISIVLIDEK